MFNNYLIKKQKSQSFIATRFHSKLVKEKSKALLLKKTRPNLVSPLKNILSKGSYKFPVSALKKNNNLDFSVNKDGSLVFSKQSFLVRETKHYPPANKEWINSVYTYNKKSLRSLSVKDNMARKLIKSFFNLHVEKTIARSKRMRSLIRKSTAKKLFLSKPEIKQTNDKVIITVYTFDREKQFLLRKLYFKMCKWEGFKRVSLKLKGFALKRKALINRALNNIDLKKKETRGSKASFNSLKKIYFSEYDEWRLKNKLKATTKKPFFAINKKENSVSSIEVKKANHYLENLSNKEIRLLDNFKTLGVKRFNYPINRNIVKAKWLENYAVTLGYNKIVSFKQKKQLKKKFIVKKSFKEKKKIKTNTGTKEIIVTKHKKVFKELAVKKKIKVKKKIETSKGVEEIMVTKYKKVFFYKRFYFRSKGDYTNVSYYLKRNSSAKGNKLNYIIKPLLRKASKIESLNRLIKKRNLMFIKKRLTKIRKKMPLFGFNHTNQINFSKHRMNNKRFLNAKKILLYFYLSYIFSLFKIKILTFEDTLKVSRKKLKKLKKEDYEILENPLNKNVKGGNMTFVSASKKEKNILLKKKVPFYVRRFQEYKLPFYFRNKASKIHLKFYYKKEKLSIILKNVSFDSLTRFLLALLKNMLTNSSSIENVKNSFKNFSNKYFLNVFYKSLFFVRATTSKKKLETRLNKFNKSVLIINSLAKLAINQTKFGKFLPQLKLLISKIYNKKAEINIVNLKSPHLNTDIFTEAVALKLKKRVGLLRVMRRSLQLVKLPSKAITGLSSEKISEEFKGNKLEILNKFKGVNPLDLTLKDLKNSSRENVLDPLQMVLKALYPRSFIFKPLIVNNKQRFFFQNSLERKNDLKLNKLSTVFNNIKYKWVSGVRLEAAGRLTRRYTASRSVFKFRQKGSLKNSSANVFLRNISKSNSQHSFLASKKRIGAFGLKSWMSSKN